MTIKKGRIVVNSSASSCISETLTLKEISLLGSWDRPACHYIIKAFLNNYNNASVFWGKKTNDNHTNPLIVILVQ